MGVAIPVRYILSKSIMAPTLRAASHTCAQQTMHFLLLFILILERRISSQDSWQHHFDTKCEALNMGGKIRSQIVSVSCFTSELYKE